MLQIVSNYARPARRAISDPDDLDFTADELAVIELGREALATWVDGGLGHLLATYDAIQIFRRKSSNKFIFCNLLRRHGFGRFTGKLGRNRLWAIQKIGDERERVVAWWETLEDHNKFKYLGPETILIRCPIFPKKHGQNRKLAPLEIALKQLPKLGRDDLALLGRAILEAHQHAVA